MTSKKTALITGVTGQDGSLLADFLLKKNYKIIGLKRRSSSFNTERINHLYTKKYLGKKFFQYYGDLTEKQFRRIFNTAEKERGDTGEKLIGLLERRLDAVVYRAKFVPTVFAARQFVLILVSTLKIQSLCPVSIILYL